MSGTENVGKMWIEWLSTNQHTVESRGLSCHSINFAAIGTEGAALYASSPNALEVLLGEALAKTWANRYNKNTVIVLWAVERNMNDQYDLEIGKLLDKGYLEYNCRMI